MNKRATVQAFMDAVQQCEFENAKSQLRDGRRFIPVRVPEKAV
jgi:hypothetical protein